MKKCTTERLSAFPISTGPCEVAPGATEIISARCYVAACRPRRLLLDPLTALNFAVVDVKVGRSSLMLSGHEASGWMFSSSAPDPGLRWPRVGIGADVTLTVRNRTSLPREFYAMLLVRLLRDRPAIDGLTCGHGVHFEERCEQCARVLQRLGTDMRRRRRRVSKASRGAP